MASAQVGPGDSRLLLRVHLAGVSCPESSVRTQLCGRSPLASQLPSCLGRSLSCDQAPLWSRRPLSGRGSRFTLDAVSASAVDAGDLVLPRDVNAQRDLF